MLAQHISKIFRDACKSHGLSTRQAAAKAEVSQKAVINLLNGHSWPDLPMIAAIESKFGIPLWISQHNAQSGTPLEPRPNCYLAKDSWPDGPLTAGAPPEAVLAQHISAVLRNACKSRFATISSAASKASISQAAVESLLNGDVWPDFETIARLEGNLGIPLWASQHSAQSGTPLEPRPNCYLARGSWPRGRLIDGAPPEAKRARRISQLFRNAYNARFYSLHSAANTTDVSEGAVESLLNGDAWPDLVTIARVERNCPLRLWNR